jgi:hypothetical protein
MINLSLQSTRSYMLLTASWLISLDLPGFGFLRQSGTRFVENLFGPAKNRMHTHRRKLSVTPDLLPGLSYPPNEHATRFIRTKRGVEIHVQSRIPTNIEPDQIRAVVCLCRKLQLQTCAQNTLML